MDETNKTAAGSKSKPRAKTGSAKPKPAKPKSRQAGQQRHEFKAETARLLHLLIHSVYSDKDIFLRELISNAADACEKMRYEAISRPELTKDDPELRITVRLDKAAGTLSVEDNGIGMDADDLAENLGVIARSGTRAFLEGLSDAKQGSQLIGQFGVGFYAAFMVAAQVDVFSTRAGSAKTFCWSSTGEEDYSITEVPDGSENARSRGTLVRLTLQKDAKDYLEPHTVERIVKAYSSHVPVRIYLQEVKDGETQQPRELSDASALWMKPKSQIKQDDYKEFYAHVSGQFDEPALTIHYRAEGRHEYAVLLFVPSAPPFDLFDPERKGRVKLYVKRVFITDGAELLPGYLRFVRGVIDSEDMPLNLSREMLQNNPLLEQIRKAVTNRLLSELKKLAEKDPEQFTKVWETFGPVVKEGLYEDFERRDELFEIARFRTTASDAWRSLKDYVAGMRENQTEIYFITGESREQVSASPQLEGFAARGVEVLLLSDPVDSFWTMTALGFEGKPFKSITQGGVDISRIPLSDEKAKESADKPADSEIASLVAMFKQTLGDAVSDVVASSRLVESPACLVAPSGGPDRRLEKLLMQREGAAASSPPVLEVNPSHGLIKALADKVVAGGAKENVEEAVWLVYDQARIAEGEGPHDAAKFCARLTENLIKAVG